MRQAQDDMMLKQMTRQLAMQNEMRERQMAMQLAMARNSFSVGLSLKLISRVTFVLVLCNLRLPHTDSVTHCRDKET